ncbi:hypothetical protein DFJ74DRAFT_696887, partial [Hyaloraphidium curvatum]
MTRKDRAAAEEKKEAAPAPAAKPAAAPPAQAESPTPAVVPLTAGDLQKLDAKIQQTARDTAEDLAQLAEQKRAQLAERATELKRKADTDAAAVVEALKAAGKDVDEHGRKLLKDAKEAAGSFVASTGAAADKAVGAGKEAAGKAKVEGEKLAAAAAAAIHTVSVEGDRLAKEAKAAATSAAEKLSKQAEDAAAKSAAAAAEARKSAEAALEKAKADLPHPEHDFLERLEKAAGALSALSTQIDPLPHFFASAACISGGLNAHYAGKTRAGLLLGSAGVLFLGSASLIGFGPEKSVKEMTQGYDLGTAAAVLLCVATLPNMFSSSVFTLLTGLGIISLPANAAKSYQCRGGEVHEPRFVD